MSENTFKGAKLLPEFSIAFRLPGRICFCELCLIFAQNMFSIVSNATRVIQEKHVKCAEVRDA